MNVVITGATGTIGAHLLPRLDGPITVLTRDPERAAARVRGARFVKWDGTTALDATILDDADAVVHLAGEPVIEGRWSQDKKRRIFDSRVRSTRAIVAALGRARPARRVFVCASAVGIYGDRGAETLTEESRRGDGFLADVCAAWEDAAREAARHEVRVVSIRTGIALAREGGAFAKMLPIFRAGLGGRVGDGGQWMPWVHVDDVAGLIRHALRSEAVEGPLNAVAPDVVTNATFTRELARALHRPAFFRVPTIALRVALGEAAEVVLASQRVVPERAIDAGYTFQHPGLRGALAHLVARAPIPVAAESHA